MNEPLMLAFVGPSGAGKTTCRRIASGFFQSLWYKVFCADVASPLRKAQRELHTVFGLEDPGSESLDEFASDGKLQAFLAGHYENRLGPLFVEYIDLIRSGLREGNAEQGLACILNADCRNNVYPYLQKAGFTFIRVSAPQALRRERRALRGDLTPFDDKAAVEQTDDIKAQYTIVNDGEDFDSLRKEVRALMAELSAKHELKLQLSDA